MPGIVDILRAGADQAARMADGLRAAREEALALSRVRAPASPPPSPPPGSPGGIVLGPDGAPAAPTSPRATGSRVGTGGGGGAGGGTDGAGAGTGFTSPSRTPDPWVESTQGGIRLPLSWISAHCTLVDQPVLSSLGTPTGATRKVWDCGDLGTFIPPREGSTISKTSSGGGGGGRTGRQGGLDTTSVARPNIPVSGIATGGVARGQNVTPPGAVSGPQSITGEVRAPGVERELQRTNDLLSRSLQTDGGAALRAAGGL